MTVYHVKISKFDIFPKNMLWNLLIVKFTWNNKYTRIARSLGKKGVVEYRTCVFDSVLNVSRKD